MTGKLVDLLLIGLATLAGIVTYYAADRAEVFAWLLALGATGLAARLVNRLFLSAPDPGRANLIASVLCIYAWHLTLFFLIAAAVAFTLAFSFWLVGELGREGGRFEIPEGQISSVASLLIGAVSGLLGAAFYEDAAKPGSKLWPGPMFKAHLTKVYGKHPHITGRKTPELYQLLYYDDGAMDLSGWRFLTALKRAWRIATLTSDLPERTT